MKTLTYVALLTGAFLGTALMASVETTTDPIDQTHAPVVIEKVMPSYPSDYARAGVEGYVVIEGLLDTQGRLVALSVVESTHQAFAQAALKALRQWRFEPVRVDGEPRMKVVRIPLQFTLGAEPKPIIGELEPIVS